MTSSEISARLRYLNDSAHLLAVSAPETSRYLMSQCNKLMFDNEIEQTDNHKRDACAACGTIMILGWGSNYEVRSKHSHRKQGSRTKDMAGLQKEVVYSCESCNRTTKFDIPTTTNIRKPKHVLSTSAQSTKQSPKLHTTVSSSANTPSSANLSSKKRAKARKQGGLEAILANKKASEARASGFGLDLMDFMKKM